MRFAEATLGITTAGSDNCSTIWPNSGYPCTTTASTATEVVASRRIEVTWPVLDTSDLMVPDSMRVSNPSITQGVGTTDGPACRRVGVAIAQDQNMPFSAVFAGVGHRVTSDSHSVGLTIYDFKNGLEPAPLVVLDRTSCNALTVGGGGGVTVGNSGDGHSGLIAVDSDGSGQVDGINGGDNCTGKKVLKAESTPNHIWALDGSDPVTGAVVPARIQLYALLANPPGPSNAFNAGDVTNCTNQQTTTAWLALGTSAPHICPVPEPGDRVTAAPWAGRYNCGGQEPDLPAAVSAPATASRFNCYEPDPNNPLPEPGDYVDQWVRYSKGSAPSTFTNQLNSGTSTAWMNNCKITADHVFVGSTYSTCADLQSSNGVKFAFTGGPVVMTGSLSPSNSSCVLFNDTNFGHCSAAVTVDPNNTGPDGGNIYIGGDLNFSGTSDLTILQSFMYVGGRISISTGSPSDPTVGIVNWIAPYARSASPGDACVAATTTVTAPTPGCFDSLGLWSRYNATNTANNKDELTSQANIVVDGTLFMPRGYFKFGGGAVNTQARAQFVALRLELRGQGELTMTPNTKRTTLIPIVEGSLIR
jgi:hypothetical protein